MTYKVLLMKIVRVFQKISFEAINLNEKKIKINKNNNKN